MPYIAHINTETMDGQLLQDHLEGTACLAQVFADSFGYGEWGYCCGKLHDIGKYSDRFQRRIRGSTETVDHATAGAQLCRMLGGNYNILSYCIAGHHAGLPNRGGSSDTGDNSTLEARIKKRIEDYKAFENEIKIPKLENSFFRSSDKSDTGFAQAFFIRMLYSCLVDADFLDTEKFMHNGDVRRKASDNMDALWTRLNEYIKDWLKCEDVNTINGRRTEILQHCMDMGKERKGLYRLTVPTGGGKTVASLAFALQHAVAHGLEHIIYVIPYTSIIEQNARVFAEILGAENVLEHHSNVNYESEEELKLKQLAAENWDKPVIVTTNVQFFESLFANKSAKCRKLHSIANSVIIFDEAQMLPNAYLKPCIAAMEELVQHYRSSIVLCTATQPALQNLFSKELSCLELCPRMEEQFTFFRRSLITDVGRISKDELLEKLREENQILCICNTKKRVREIYEEIKGDGVCHLSTYMYPNHRKRMLKKIREDLKQSKKCIVIATSLVEAGVDLDFQTVYRELAGVDSCIQAAGRCNREGKRDLLESYTYIFQFENAEKIPGQEQQIDISRSVFRKYKDISDLKAINEYFVRLYSAKGTGLDKKNILGQFQRGNFPFAKVGREFKIIEQSTKTILIPKENRAKEIVEELNIKGATRALMREAGQYCINVYETLFSKMFGAGMLIPVSEELKEELFLLKDPDDYAEDVGLKINIRTADGIWI